MNKQLWFSLAIVALAALWLIGGSPTLADGLAGQRRVSVVRNSPRAAVPGWQQSNTSGFGTASNNMISALAVLNNQMYATTWNDAGAQVWRTSDGKTWSQFTPSSSYTTTTIYDAKSYGCVSQTVSTDVRIIFDKW